MERLPNETLDNAISVYETTMRVTGDNGEPCYLPIDKATLCFLKELKAYRDAEEQGLLLRLPCKVGDTVWFVGNEFVNDYEVRRFIVDETGIDCVQISKEIDGRDYWNSFSIDNIGKTVFLTKEEAEQKLAEMKFLIEQNSEV